MAATTLTERTEPLPSLAPRRASERPRRRIRDHLSGHAFLLGAVVCFAFFSWYPMIKEIIMSFQKTRRGVTSWVGWASYQRVWLILSLMFLLQVVATMQVFIEPLILAGGNGVQDSATSLVYLMYSHAFRLHDLNSAAALGVMLLLVLIVFSALYVKLSPKQDS